MQMVILTKVGTTLQEQPIRLPVPEEVLQELIPAPGRNPDQATLGDESR